MNYGYFRLVVFILIWVILPVLAVAQDESPDESGLSIPEQLIVHSIKPDFLPPSQILEILGVQWIKGRSVIEWRIGDRIHRVDIRRNDPANLLILSGNRNDVDHAIALIREADIAPRQIEIEVKIVEINTSKAREVGLDWDRLWNDIGPRASYRLRSNTDENSRQSFNSAGIESSTYDERRSIIRYHELTSSANLAQSLSILDESGAAEIHNAPKILTLNNRRATILDGERVTYVTRYSSYTNLFETDSMDAGLTMSVLPSLGESGYITLEVNAEFTSLAGNISGSPVKSGQLIENTIIVKDGESILLGGLSRTIKDKQTRRFPILGHILPFLFSHEADIFENIESFIVLTTRVVDFNTAIDEATENPAKDG